MGTKDDIRGLKADLVKSAAEIRAEIETTRKAFGQHGAETVRKLHGLQGVARELGEVNKELDELLEGSNSAYALDDELSPTKADG